MSKAMASSDPRKIALWAAGLALGTSMATIGFLAGLHALSPEFDPSWRVVSEYALGNYAWVLSLMFSAWALSSWSLALAIRSQVRTMGGKVGLGFLVVAGTGEALAALFDVTWPKLHGVAGLLGVPCLPIAAVLISLSLGRTQEWHSTRRQLLGTACITWLSLVWMAAATAVLKKPPSPLLFIGWPNRILVAVYCSWVMMVAWNALALRRQVQSPH